MVITLARSNPLRNRLVILTSIAMVASACGGGGGGGGGSSDGDTPTATPVSISQSDQLVLEVQPIQVCDDAGIVCAQVEFFEAVTDKIWGQAGIDVTFLPVNQLNDSTYLTTDDDEFFDLSFTGAPGDFGRNPESTDTSGPINLWFVDEIESAAGLIQFGNAWIGLNGVLISDDIFDANDGDGRIDVIAHELGHNLGLRHSSAEGDSDNVLAGGSIRDIPESIDDIFPDGDGLSQLNSDQIEVAQGSSFVSSAAQQNDIVPVTEADAVPIELLASAGPSTPIALTSVQPVTRSEDVASLLSSTQPTAVPEGSPTPLTWLVLLLLPLGQKGYSRSKR